METDTNNQFENYDLFQLLNENSAVVIDVRSESEFRTGNVKDSINIPLESIPESIDRLREITEPKVFCCLSGARSAMAADYLSNAGIENVFNGGSWKTVEMQLIRK